MKSFVYTGAIALVLMGGVLVPNASAETNTSSVLEQIKALMAKVEELQKQLSTVRGEIKSVIREGVAEGMSGDDIKQIQELLATDPSVYPEGKVTGYFGPLTKEAVKRLQKRHDLAETGVIDEATHDLLEQYLKERFGEKVPPGLLKAPGIAKKIELRVKDGCDNSKGAVKALFCEKLKVKYGDDDEDDEDDDNDDGFDVEVELEDGDAKVSFTFEDDEYELEVSTTTLSAILDEVAEALDVDVDDIDSDLREAIEDAYDDAVDEDEDNEAKEEAEHAIDDAKDAIEDAEDAIDDADGDTDEAEELLEKAEEKLGEAEDAFDDEDYDDAKSLAEAAEEFAEDAEDEAE